MLKGLFCFLILLGAATQLQAQYQPQLYTTTPALVHRISISGIIYDQGKLYLAAERCHRVFVLDAATGRVTDTITVSHPGDLELEGITAYKNKLYAVSENDASVYVIDPLNGRTERVMTDRPFPPIYRGDGLEGIAVNAAAKKMYVLLERDSSRSHAFIYTFDIAMDAAGKLVLHYNNTLSLPLESRFWRYTDLAFDPTSRRLLCLKSWYNKPEGKYAVEYLQAAKNGILIPQTSTMAGLDTSFLTPLVYKYKARGFGSNMEGLTIDAAGNLYLASDNAMGEADCRAPLIPDPAAERTLLLYLAPAKKQKR